VTTNQVEIKVTAQPGTEAQSSMNGKNDNVKLKGGSSSGALGVANAY
jgi:hypothetical protein